MNSKRNIGLIIAGLVIVIVLAMIFMRGKELQEFVEALRTGSPIFLALGVLTQLGKYFSQGWGYRACFTAVNERIHFSTGLTMVFGTFFVNTIAPSLNLAGASLVVDLGHKQGIRVGKSTSAAFLMQLCIDSAFVTVMVISFITLALTVGLEPGWFGLGMIAVLLVGGLATIMILGATKPDFVLKILEKVERLVNRVLARFKRGPLKPWAEGMVESFSEASKEIAHKPMRTLRAWLCSFAASICEIACFCFVGVAFGITEVEPLICGYVLATLFAMVSFIPQGVGVVEAAVMVGFGLFGINTAAGMATVMVYRSIVFWMPFLIGAVVIQRLGFKAGNIDKAEEKITENAKTQNDES